MENLKEDRLSMFQKVLGYMELHTAEISTIPSVIVLKDEFAAKVTSILQLAATSGTDITGFTVDKQSKRMDLKAKTLKLSTAIVAFSAINDNYSLSEKCDETPSAMDAMRDNDLYTYCKLVFNEALPLMASLSIFGVTAADYETAVAASETYLSVIQNPRVQITERSTANLELEQLFQTSDAFLKNKLDKVMGIFMVSNPILHAGYLSSRSVDSTGTRTEADYVGVVGANTLKMVAELPYLSSRSFEFKNTGTVPLSFALSVHPDMMEGDLVTVDAGMAATRLSSRMNFDTNASRLYVKNDDAALPGEFKVFVAE